MKPDEERKTEELKKESLAHKLIETWHFFEDCGSLREVHWTSFLEKEMQGFEVLSNQNKHESIN